MKILFLSPNYRKRVNWGHQLFRDKVMEMVPNSMQYGEGCEKNGKTHVPEILREVGSHDVIIMENQKNMQKYTGLEEIDCLKVMYLGDYLRDGRGNVNEYNRLINTHKISIALCPTPRVKIIADQEKRMGRLRNECQTYILPYSVDVDIYKPRPELEKIYDVMAVYGLVSYIYPNRPAVQSMIAEMPVRSLIGDWGSKLRWMDYARAISQSNIFVSVNGIHNQITMKYTEAMASGALLLTNEPEDFGWFGYIKGYHCVVWSSLEDLRKKILYYLENKEARQDIAERGRVFVCENFSTEVMAERLIRKLNATNATGYS